MQGGGAGSSMGGLGLSPSFVSLSLASQDSKVLSSIQVEDPLDNAQDATGVPSSCQLLAKMHKATIDAM